MQDSGTDTDKETDQSGRKKTISIHWGRKSKVEMVKLMIKKGGKAHKMEGDKA